MGLLAPKHYTHTHTHTQSDFQNQDNLISWTSGKQITGKQCQHKDMRRNR